MGSIIFVNILSRDMAVTTVHWGKCLIPKLTILTQICHVRDTLRWKLKGGDLKLVIVLFIKIYMGCKLKLADKDLYPNIHTILKCSIVLPVKSVCCERTFSAAWRLKTWVRSTMTGERLCGLAMLSQKHGCESGKHFLRRWCLWPP